MSCTCKSIDHKLVKDDLILQNMLELEECYLIQNTYFSSEITSEMRSTLATWMLEVCEEEKLTNEIFYLSMNLFDRFMCSMKNSSFQPDKTHLQLFGVTCMFIASKVRSSEQLNAFKLIEYTDNSIRLEELLELELLVLEKLRWDVDLITPNDYLEIYLHKFGLNANENLDVIKRYFFTLTALCSTEFKFSFYPSSMVASACLLAALETNSINNFKQVEQLMSNLLFKCAQIDSECLSVLKEQIKDLIKQSTEAREDSKEIVFEDDYDFNFDFNLKCEMDQDDSSHDSLLTSSNFEFSFLSLSPSQEKQIQKSLKKLNRKNRRKSIKITRNKSNSLSSLNASITSDLGSSFNSSSSSLSTPPSETYLPLPTF